MKPEKRRAYLKQNWDIYGFPKNFVFALFFGLSFDFINNFKIYVQKWCGSKLIFFMVISKTFPPRLKKNQISEAFSTCVVVSLKFESVSKVLRCCSCNGLWNLLVFFKEMSQIPDFCPNKQYISDYKQVLMVAQNSFKFSLNYFLGILSYI